MRHFPILRISVASIPRPGIVGQRVDALVILIHIAKLFSTEMVTIKHPPAMDECADFPIGWPTKR